MVKKTVTIINPSGLQVEAAGVLCDATMKYSCHVSFLYRGGSEANAKSVLSILGACIRKGETIELCCDGSDEKQAMEELVALIEKGFEH